jgi:hypothetical protein
MKLLLIIFSTFCFFTSFGQTETTTDYQNIQGKWICTTPKYKKHTFWVKKLSFFQNYDRGVLEQGLPYQIEKPNGEEIEIVGLFVKCSGCYDDVWTITELTPKELILVNYETEEMATYKKVLNVKPKKK